MKSKKTPVIVPILWFVATILYTITFAGNASRYGIANGLVILQGATVLVSLAAAIVNLIRYRKTKDIHDD